MLVDLVKNFTTHVLSGRVLSNDHQAATAQFKQGESDNSQKYWLAFSLVEFLVSFSALIALVLFLLTGLSSFIALFLRA